MLVKFFVSFAPLSPHPFVPYASPLVNNQPQASKANEQLTANLQLKAKRAHYSLKFAIL